MVFFINALLKTIKKLILNRSQIWQKNICFIVQYSVNPSTNNYAILFQFKTIHLVGKFPFAHRKMAEYALFYSY